MYQFQIVVTFSLIYQDRYEVASEQNKNYSGGFKWLDWEAHKGASTLIPTAFHFTHNIFLINRIASPNFLPETK